MENNPNVLQYVNNNTFLHIQFCNALIKMMISNVFLHLLTHKDEHYLLLHMHILLHINDDFSIKWKYISHMILHK